MIKTTLRFTADDRKTLSEEFRERLSTHFSVIDLSFLQNEEFDDGVIGVTQDCRVVYDIESCITALMKIRSVSRGVASAMFDSELAPMTRGVPNGPVFVNTGIRVTQ